MEYCPGSFPGIGSKQIKMPTIEDQIIFITSERDASLELSSMVENSYRLFKHAEMYSAVLENLKLLQSNELVLQRKCLHCNDSFTTTNMKQQFCTVKCRVAYFRAKNRLKEFTAKVYEILRGKETDPKFLVGVLLVPEKHCPYEVEYKGNVYNGKTTREILTKLKKL